MVTDVLMNQLPDITGGQLIVNDDVIETANQLEAIIIDRRRALGLIVEDQVVNA